MQSMTGYGRANLSEAGREMTVEIKTVNHRFLDINLRMPRGLLFLEEPVRKAIGARLSRGHADVFVTYRNLREDARKVSVDIPLLRAYADALDQIARAASVADDRSVMALSALPDVLTTVEGEENQEEVSSLCLQALDKALETVVEMRSEEGAALSADMRSRIDRLEAIAAEIAERAPLVSVQYKQKLEERIAELLGTAPDPQRLAQEVALLADRAAIDEELVRLGSHFAQFRAICAQAEPVGRKLDFLVQELNREMNTIGSKASDLQITTLSLAAKAEIEKIREQVQNIE